MDIAAFQLIEVIAGTIVGMLLGAIWYSPAVFGSAWMTCLGKTPETLGKQTIPMIGSIVASFLTALGVSILSFNLDIDSLSGSLSLGAVLGFLLVFPALLSDNLFCSWGSKLLLIQSGYRILSVTLMTVVIYYV